MWGPQGEALDFVQEDKLRDSEFAVVLKKPLAAGETIQLTTAYAGKDAVNAEGNNNFYLVARENRYPKRARSWGELLPVPDDVPYAEGRRDGGDG